jgi:UDP-2,4-diacetamido-2,4,6-trideoxy-beta-L-altropyranose hydrolase
MRILIRADGGPNIGYGHVVRTGAIASELHGRGHDITFSTTTPAHLGSFVPKGVYIDELNSRGDPKCLVESIERLSPEKVLIDSYPADTEYQRIVRERVPVALVSDDDRGPVCADLVVNGNLYARDLEYESVGDEPTWCLGPEYLVLREAVASLSDATPPWREVVSEVLVTMGGSDVRGWTPTVIRSLDGLDVSVTVVIGPGFSNEGEIQDVVARADLNCNVVRTPTNLPELMFEADMAVTACGSTSYELLALGTPSIAVVQAKNQRLIADALDERDLATVLPVDVTESDLRAAARNLLDNPDRRRRYRERGRKAVPGTGRAAVSDALLNVVD